MTLQKIQQKLSQMRTGPDTKKGLTLKKASTPAFSALHEQLQRSCANSQIGAWK